MHIHTCIYTHTYDIYLTFQKYTVRFACKESCSSCNGSPSGNQWLCSNSQQELRAFSFSAPHCLAPAEWMGHVTPGGISRCNMQQAVLPLSPDHGVSCMKGCFHIDLQRCNTG